MGTTYYNYFAIRLKLDQCDIQRMHVVNLFDYSVLTLRLSHASYFLFEITLSSDYLTEPNLRNFWIL